MPNFKKSSSFRPTPNHMIIILCSIFVIIMILLKYNPYDHIAKQPEAKSIASADYMNSVQTWQSPGDGVSYPTKGISVLSTELTSIVKNTSNFNLYVYDNPIGFFVKPNIETVFDDLLQGINYQTSRTPTCYHADELYVRRAKRNCLSDGTNCYSVYGNRIGQGQEEIYNEAGDIPPCTDFIGNISFNFTLDGANIIDPKTKFMDVESLYCSSTNYKKQTDLTPYFKDIDFLIADDNRVPSNDYYLPQITNMNYKANSINQKFIIRRYNWKSSSKSWESKSNGVFSAIILKAGNLYMTAQVFPGCITQIQPQASLQNPPQTNTPYFSIPVKQRTNQTARINVIFGDSADTQPEIIIVNSGQGYDSNSLATIKLGSTTFNVSLATKNDYKIIFKEIADEDDLDTLINWVLLPSIDFNPGKVDFVNKLDTSSNTVLNQYVGFGILAEVFKKKDVFNSNNIISFDSNNLIEGAGSQKIDKDSIFVQLYSNISENGLGTIVHKGSDEYDYDETAVIQSINPDLSVYPDYKYQCIIGGVPSSQIDFTFGYGITATGGDDFRTTIKLLPGLSLPNSDKVGELISDNEVVWKVRDFLDNVAVFNSDYFVDSKIGPGVAQATLSNGGATYTPTGSQQKKSIYRKGKKGFISTININNINYKQQALANKVSFSLVLNNDNTENLEISTTDYAEIFIIIINRPSQNGTLVGTIQSVDIIKSGSGYKNSTFSIKIPGVPENDNIISNVVIQTQDIEPIFKAVPVDSYGNPKSISSMTGRLSEGLVVSGLTIDNDQGLSVDPTSGLTINFPGYNYSVNQNVYLNQIYNNETYIDVLPNGDNVPTTGYSVDSFISSNLSSLAKLTVRKVQAPDIASEASPHSLNRSGVPTNQLITEGDIQYNFYTNDKISKKIINNNSFYTPSPQQIGFLESTVIFGQQTLKDIMKNNISDNNPENFYNLFQSYKDLGVFTNFVQLKTLQFPNLNYVSMDYSDKTKLPTNMLLGNKLNQADQLVLGRFIPYGVFSPPTKSGSDNEIPTGDPTKIFYNNNSTQIINYGLKNIFNVPVKPTTLNTF